jgi:hypothetical protein
MDQSINLPKLTFSSGTFSEAYNENGQSNGAEEEHKSTAVQVDDESITWGYDHSNVNESFLKNEKLLTNSSESNKQALRLDEIDYGSINPLLGSPFL